MATLLELSIRGDLIRYDPGLGENQLENRCIYVFPRVLAWIENRLPNIESDIENEHSPEEQLDDFLAAFCRGDALAFGRQFHSLIPIGDSVWELKTPDVRLFGWFAACDCFVATDGAAAGLVKRLRMYAGYRDQAIRLRNQLELNEPKNLHGDAPDGIVSNFYFS